MDHPVAVCTSTVSKKRKIVWELESLNLIPIILDEEILVIKVEAYPTFYQTYFYQLTWFWHLGYKISLSVMDTLTVMLFLPRCNPLPRIWMMRSGAALAKSALTCIIFNFSYFCCVEYVHVECVSLIVVGGKDQRKMSGGKVGHGDEEDEKDEDD